MNPLGLYILNERGEPVECEDFLKHAMWLSCKDNTRVKVSYVGKSHISTIFLGIDHRWGDGPPVLWETMVFRGAEWSSLSNQSFPKSVDQERYTSRAEAIRRHDEMVATLEAALRATQMN